MGGNNGVAVALDTFQGLYNPSTNFVGLTTDAIGGGRRHSGPGRPAVGRDDEQCADLPCGRPIHVVVTTTSTGVDVSINGTQVLTWTGTLPTKAYLAFTGGDGKYTDLHAVENVTIAVTNPSNPSPLSGPATMLATYLSNNSRTGYSPSQTALTTSNASSLKLAGPTRAGRAGSPSRRSTTGLRIGVTGTATSTPPTRRPAWTSGRQTWEPRPRR